MLSCPGAEENRPRNGWDQLPGSAGSGLRKSFRKRQLRELNRRSRISGEQQIAGKKGIDLKASALYIQASHPLGADYVVKLYELFSNFLHHK
jgi:hypothetical protein